ncbi:MULTISPECIES: hypothetical protein [unclassified Paenibacillus]|uniref:hypothetical protein n=1 Tax=unclassified Paenibacillus TaxID=185978 RepID=UPI001F3A1B4A|nr:hypothetical protein [Paenibacillus sp. JJ-223]CAH1219928.1 hypothetical protein PAECIP111890_04942 [Paenibacillus sp. JJ-223]
MKKTGKFITSTVIATVAAVSIGSAVSAQSSTYVGSSIPSVTGIDLQSMDLETALMMVQTQRAALLEQQLKSQLDAVQQRNQQIAQLNEQLQQAQLRGDQAAVQAIKSQIDALGSSQQMDMLRLQSLSNKRNEAFDVMTNFIKKMQDSRSSIIGNMR